MWSGARNLTTFSILLLFCFRLSELVIVPQELPSILSLIYSNIPPIKKGTDSRLGFGFRLGEHADFQVMLELGPQKETQPIGDKQGGDNSFNKRQVAQAELRKLLFRQELQQRLQQQQQQEQLTSTERSASNWLSNWSNDMSTSAKKTKQKHRFSVSSKGEREKEALMPTMPSVPTDALLQLQQLYKLATTPSPSTAGLTTTTIATRSNQFDALAYKYDGSPLNLGPPAAFTAAPEDLQAQPTLLERKTKAEITAELMNVSLEDGA